jgi:hypothetical protein
VLAHDRWSLTGIPPLLDWHAMLTEAFATCDFLAAATARPG